MERESAKDTINNPHTLNEVHLRNEAGERTTAWMVADPTLISLAAWQDILTYQITSESPLTFAIETQDKQTYKIGYEEFLKARYYSEEQVENFLVEKLSVIGPAKKILLGRETSPSSS